MKGGVANVRCPADKEEGEETTDELEARRLLLLRCILPWTLRGRRGYGTGIGAGTRH